MPPPVPRRTENHGADVRNEAMMDAGEVVRVNPRLLDEVRRYGRFDTSCFNCGTCTLSCDLSDASASFPRRTIQYAMLGITDRLHAGLEPWLCQDCGDCSTRCPREADPRDSMATLRRYLAAQYDWTGLAARISRSKAAGIGALLSAGLLVLGMAVAYHLFSAEMPLSELAVTPMGMEHMFPAITWFTLAVIVFPWVILLSHAVRMHRFTMRQGAGARIPLSLYFSELKTLMVYAITQRRLGECPDKTHKVRWIKHLVLASGGMLMFVLLVFFLRFFQTDAIHPVHHPQRWLGYIATAFLVYGSADILIGRLKKKKELYGHSEWSDYSLPLLILLTAVSGIAVHLARYLGFPLVSHYAYLLHLMIAVPTLVVEVPFGKWSHIFHRPLAIYLQSAREKAAAPEIGEKLEAA